MSQNLFDEEKTWLQRDFGLDRRLIKALSKLGFTFPTLVQAKSIPVALLGKDLMVRARTGSGKTVAFSLPILQKILTMKEAVSVTAKSNAIKCVVLAPTKELIKQIEQHMTDLIYYCQESITICSLTDDDISVQQYRLQSKPDIVISTPARLVHHVKSKKVDLASANTLVIDEADLVLSYGYQEDVHVITSSMPKIFQGLIMSATLSADLDKFKKLVLHNPAILRLEEPTGVSNMLQYYLESTEKDKFLILYVFLKLGLLQGKGLIFVNDINKAYRLKLFFQQFFIPTAVLNSELPLNSRLHVLEEYNRGVFDYLIATDSKVDNGEDEDEEENDGEDADKEKDEDEDNEGDKGKKQRRSSSSCSQKSKKATATDEDYGVSRGIDFQGVNFVVNFDFPLTAAAYTHRIGRTARGGASGTALSFVTTLPPTSSTMPSIPNIEKQAATRDFNTLVDVQSSQPRVGVVENSSALGVIGAAGTDAQAGGGDVQPGPLVFNLKELDSFRYRVEDTLRSVTGVAVKELRNAEVKREIINSEKLKDYFTENPNDLKVLRHDKAILHPIRQLDHLKNVPQYLIPQSMRSVAAVNTRTNNRRKRKNDGSSQEVGRSKSKQKDPLYSVNVVDGEGGMDGSSGSSSSSGGGSNGNSSIYSGGDGDGEASGRNQWKMNHRKGKFNPKLKKNTDRVAGTFLDKKKKNFYKK